MTRSSYSAGTKRKNPIELRMAISSAVTGPVSTMGSVKSSRPAGLSTRAHSAITRGRFGQVVDRVDARHGVEAVVGEWQWLAGVRTLEPSPIVQATRAGERARRGDGLVVHVDPDDRTSGLVEDAQRRPAGSAPDVQKRVTRRQRQPLDERVLLVGGEPAVLPDVFAERLAADRFIDGVLEASVIRVVVREATVCVRSRRIVHRAILSVATVSRRPRHNMLVTGKPTGIYYGWTVLVVAALAMVGTLPGRTQATTLSRRCPHGDCHGIGSPHVGARHHRGAPDRGVRGRLAGRPAWASAPPSIRHR